jgi:hypothetical protein
MYVCTSTLFERRCHVTEKSEEILVIPVDKVVDQKKNTRKKWRAEEEERHKGGPKKCVQKHLN